MARPSKKTDGRTREARAAKAAKAGAVNNSFNQTRVEESRPMGLADRIHITPVFKLDPMPAGHQAANTALGRALLSNQAGTVPDGDSGYHHLRITPTALIEVLTAAMDAALSRFAEIAVEEKLAEENMTRTNQ